MNNRGRQTTIGGLTIGGHLTIGGQVLFLAFVKPRQTHFHNAAGWDKPVACVRAASCARTGRHRYFAVVFI